MQREVLSDDKSEKGLWLISTNFPLIQGLVKFISQLITDFQNQLKSTIKVKNKKHNLMMPIEHFLVDIIQILLRDWIEKTIPDIGR